MIGWETKMDVISLYKQHISIRKICTLTCLSRNTVKKIIKNSHAPKGNRKTRSKLIDQFSKYVQNQYEAGFNSHLIHQQIQKMGFTGGYDCVQRYIRTLRLKEVASKKATVRFETAAGFQGQMDWGYCGHSVDKNGKKKSLYVFAYVLGFSRYCYVEFTESMNLEVLINCHKNAFDYCNGVPSQILYDNMKQIKINGNQLNPTMLDFSKYYGFSIKTCRVRRPRTKGKVERLIRYFKHNFLPGKSFSSLADANAQAREWMHSVANDRIHGTTQKKPSEMLPLEALQDHKVLAPFKLIKCAERKVSAEAFVSFEGNKYSTPPEAVCQKVTVENFGEQIKIYSKNRLIAEHSIEHSRGKTIAKEEHIAQMWKLSVTESNEKVIKKQYHQFNESVCERPLSDYEGVIA